MTLIIQLPNTQSYSYLSGNACKVLGPSIPEVPVDQVNDLCICDFIQCLFIEKVFGHLVDTELYKNDKNEFLFKRFIAADTVDMELHLDGVKVADLNTNALGTYFPSFTGSAEQQLYKGYLVDWQKVLIAHGPGYYTIVANLVILGNPSTFESRIFNLCQYSDRSADGTVRIESTQNGNIIGGQFDYTDLNWYQSNRIPGRFGNPKPVYEKDHYTTSTTNRKIRQIKDKMSQEWSLKTKPISWDVALHLVYNKLLANEILITDYSILGESVWRRIGVFVKEIEKPDLILTPKRNYNVTFVLNEDIYQKRNF